MSPPLCRDCVKLCKCARACLVALRHCFACTSTTNTTFCYNITYSQVHKLAQHALSQNFVYRSIECTPECAMCRITYVPSRTIEKNEAHHHTLLPHPLYHRVPNRMMQAFLGVPNAKRGNRTPQSSYMARSTLGTVHKDTICGEKRPKKVRIVTKTRGKGCIGVYII